MAGGDDFEDDFVLDDLVATSGDELEVEYEEPSPDRISDVANAAAAPPGEEPQDARQSKKRKLREKEKLRKKRKLAASLDAAEVPSVASQTPLALLKYLSSMQDKTFPSMSALELDDIRIPETSIADTSSWTGPRTLDHLADFISKVLPSLRTRLSQKSKSNGSPTLLFIAGAALRVADVTRILKDKRLRGEKAGEVAKLFAKHFKLSEHVSYLKRTKIGSAAGTPGRVGKLLCEEDALTVSALTHIILDITFRDSKNRSLLDIPETRDEVFKTVLGAPTVLEGLKQGKIQLVLF